MFDFLYHNSDLSPDVYKNIEDSIIEISERNIKQFAAQKIEHTHDMSENMKIFITNSVIPPIVKR